MTLTVIAQTLRKITVAACASVALTFAAPPALAQMTSAAPDRVEFSIDLAEDMNLFIEPRVPVGEEPLRGSFFVTEGKIFPAGTIPASNPQQFDPNAVAGAIGKWFCKGTFLVRGSEFEKSPSAVLTDQIYIMRKGQISTTGFEGAGTAVRAVVGGTGPFAGYTGEQTQEFLGFNKTGGVNLRVHVKLRRYSDFR